MENKEKIALIRTVAKNHLESKIQARSLPADMTIEVDEIPFRDGSGLGARVRTQVVTSRKVTRPHFAIIWSPKIVMNTKPRMLVDGFFGLASQRPIPT